MKGNSRKEANFILVFTASFLLNRGSKTKSLFKTRAVKLGNDFFPTSPTQTGSEFKKSLSGLKFMAPRCRKVSKIRAQVTNSATNWPIFR